MRRVAAAGRLEDYWVDTGAFEGTHMTPENHAMSWTATPSRVVRIRSMGVGTKVLIPGAVGRYVIRSIHDTHEGRMAILADEKGREFAHPYRDLFPVD